MKRLCFVFMLTTAAATSAFCAKPFTGRWDLTIVTPKMTYPSWMEVTDNNGSPEVKIVGRVASVHPVTDMKLEGNHLTFHSSEYFGDPIPVDWDMTVSGKKLTGTQKRSDGVEGKITGEPAPALKRKEPKKWPEPEALFNGKDLTGWEPDDPATNNWKADNGELLNVKAGANIRTVRKFQDYKLHIEFNCPSDGNSGVYQRGRYEVQVEYEPADKNDKFHGIGAVYGFLAPEAQVPPRPGQWESYDITLVGRTITVIRDGVLTIDHKEIPGITGGALDSHEAEPQVLYIQGDHTGGMKYRNITIAAAK